MDSNGQRLGVIVGNWGIRRKVVPIGASIGNACVMSWKSRGGDFEQIQSLEHNNNVFTQIRIAATNYICHPTLSGASLPTFVGVAATHPVGDRCIVLVTRGFVAASCVHVMLASLMAMLPTVVARERRVGGPHWPRSSRHHCRGAGWLCLG